MLVTAFRDGLAAVRAAGGRAYALALLSYAPVAAADLIGNVLFSIVVVGVQLLVAVALIRLLGAYRPVPVPPPPQVDERGRRVLPPPNPGPPLSPDDARVGGALRNAVKLLRPVVSMTGLILLALVSALLVVFALAGDNPQDYDPRILLLAALPVGGVFLAFIMLAPHRIALEGETRVLVATAHSVRIARTAYGPLLLLTLADSLVAALLSFALPEKDPPLALAAAVAAATLVIVATMQVVTTAVANEIYLTGPRLDLPADPGS